jgi:hypothetical protein
MSTNDVLALVSIAGFATQRSLELLDPIFIFIAKFKVLIALFGDEKTGKAWCMAVAGFGIGIIIALSNGDYTLPGLGPRTTVLVIALAISMGSNATNSLVKFGEHVKEAQKKQVEPLPEVSITPKTVTVPPGAQINFLASVSVSDEKAVTWRVLEREGGTITPASDGNGEYKAPVTPGTFHVAAISVANPAATATAIVTVQNA